MNLTEKKLTKEECLTAIDVVARYCNEVKQGHIPPRFELTNELDVLMKVVEEHFDNPFLSLLSNLLDGTVIVIKVEQGYIRAKKSFFGEWIHYNWRRQGGVFDE